MIDVDLMEEQLANALTVAVDRRSAHRQSRPAKDPAPEPTPAPVRPPTPTPRAEARPRRVPAAPRPARAAARSAAQAVAAPTPAPAPAVATPPPVSTAALGVRELLERRLLQEADARIAAATGRRDAATWAAMRALLDGRADAARTALDELCALARASNDPETCDRWWALRFWIVAEWGNEDERYEILNHCRERAYRFDDLEWWGRLTLLLAVLGKGDEAIRAFDEALDLVSRHQPDAVFLDAVTDLLEAMFVLGDDGRAGTIARTVRWPESGLVVVGPGVVCKGPIERYLALAHLVVGNGAEARACFMAAEATLRTLGAEPLRARALRQAARGRVTAA